MSRLTKLEKSWITYDWANSVYATIMMAAIYPVFFSSVMGKGGDGWWAFGTFLATLVMAILAPVLGAIGDFRGMKKRLLVSFLLLGLTFTLIAGLAGYWPLMLAAYVLSYIGFMGSNLFYDSFLTDVTTKERMDKVSAWGYGMGYIGGSTIPFVLSIILIMAGPSLGLGEVLPVRISIFLAVVWWGLFSIPLLKNVHQHYHTETPPSRLLQQAFRNLGETVKNIRKDRAVLVFLIAYFFYIDGVNTVINMATSYGATLGLDTTGMILALLVTQLIAFPFAILFGRLAGKIGSIPMILAAVALYSFICVLGFVMGLGIEEGFLTVSQALVLFWILAVLVGTSQGGIQALSRSFFGRIIPPERSTEYFGFYDIFGKFAAIMGPGLYSLVKALTGRSSLSILGVIILFILGGFFIIWNRKILMLRDAASR